VAHLRKAIACPRAFTLAYELLARTLEELGHRQESARIVTEWLARDPANATAQRLAAGDAAAENTPALVPEP